MAPRILVVEDEPAIAESVAYALGRDGFSVTLAATASAATALAEGADLVVLDRNLTVKQTYIGGQLAYTAL